MLNQNCQEEYIRRIHKVQDYIELHIGENLTIEELSNAAGFSKFHFSRIFQGILHETLAHYVNRLRMERALFWLAHRTDLSITDIAYELGIFDSAVFSRAFKNYYGVSPSEYRKEYSKSCKDIFLLSEYNKTNVNYNPVAEESSNDLFPVTGQITIQELEDKQVAYVRHTGTYDMLWEKYQDMTKTLFTEASKQHLLVKGENWVLSIYHDNPEFGDATQFRTSLCLTVPDKISIQEDGILGTMKLEGGLYAVGHFEIQLEEYEGAWNYMYQLWLTHSGYVPRNSCPFEVYRNDPNEDERHIHVVDIYVPIEPIRC